MRKELWITALLSTFITLLAIAPVGYIAYRNRPPQVATVDLQKLVEEQQQTIINALSKGAPTDAQRTDAASQTETFAKKLSKTVDDLGAECKCVIVNKAALLGGALVDYTDLVRERLTK